MADATVSIGADLTTLRRELGKLPNLSTEAAQKTLIQVEKAVQKAEKAAKKSTKAINRANKQAAKEAEKNLKSAQEGLKGLAELGGLSGDKLEKVSKVFGALSSPVGIAAIAIGGVTLALTGMVAGIGAAVLAADDLIQELAPLEELEGFGGLDPEVVASITAANSAVSGLGMIAKEMVVILAAEFAPVVEDVATLLVKLGLMALDTWKSFQEGHSILRELAVWIVKEFVQALATPIDPLMKIVDGWGQVAAALGKDDIAAKLTGVRDSWEGWTESVAETAVDFYFDAAADSLDSLGESTSDYDERAQALIGKMTELGRETGKTTGEIKSQDAALKKLNSTLDFLVEASRDLNEQQALGEMLGGLAPDDLIPAETIQRTRDLTAAVDALIPPEALSEVDQLGLLLLQLESAYASTGSSNEMLSEGIDRVNDRLTALEAEAQGAGEALQEAADPSTWEKVAAGVEKVSGAVSGISGALGAALGMVDSLLTALTGFSLSDLGSVATEEGGDAGAVVEEMIAGALAMVDSIIAALPEILQALIDGLPAVFDAVIEAIPLVVDALVAALPGLFDLIAEKLPDLILVLVQEIPRLVVAIVNEIPGLVDAILQALPVIIEELIAGVGDIVAAVIAAVPDIVISVIEAIPEILAAIVEAIPQLAADIITAIVSDLLPRLPEIAVSFVTSLVSLLPQIITGLVEGFIVAIPDIISSLVAAIPELVSALWEEIFLGIGDFAEKLWDALSGWLGDLFGEDTSDKGESWWDDRWDGTFFSDTPGAVKAPLEGLTARFAPGDTVIAAQDPQEALRQAQQAAGSTGSTGSSRVVLDLRDGHLAFDRLFRTNIQTGGSLSSLRGRQTGQVKVYG